MVFGWGESEDAYQQVYQGGEEHNAEMSHELIGGAAAFAAFKAFEDRQRKEGKPVEHAFAKELLAGIAGAEVDKLAETKGEDFVDRERAKRHAKENAERMYDQHYGQYDQYDPSYDAPSALNRELEQELVPEWSAKYLNYKQAKKKLKAVARALRSVNDATPRTPRRRGPNAFTPSPFQTAPTYTFLNRSRLGREHGPGELKAQERRDLVLPANASPKTRARDDGDGWHAPRDDVWQRGRSTDPEEQPLTSGQGDASLYPRGRMTRYGSIIGSPPRQAEMADSHVRRPPTLSLPGPAMDLSQSMSSQNGRPNSIMAPKRKRDVLKDLARPGCASEDGEAKAPRVKLDLRHRSIFQPKRVNSMPGTEGARPFVRRAMSQGVAGMPTSPRDTDVPLDAYREVDVCQADFFNFLDLELEKVEAFYKEKEGELTERLKVLREQLHIMRDRRLEELLASQTAKWKKNHENNQDGAPSKEDGDSGNARSNGHIKFLNSHLFKPIDNALEAAWNGRIGKGTKAMEQLSSPTGPHAIDALRYSRHDYSRRPVSLDVPYRTAKRKLKVALQEYYRGLELLKSYTLLNHTAFRKITKKYDKTVNARPTMRYMSEKVNHANFVQSDVLDGQMRAVEDLYARYFERGNHKVAASKLRAKAARAGDYTASVFRNGLTVATGLVFGIEGLVYAAQSVYSPDPVLSINTSYLLQIYAGYGLALLLTLLFCLACRLWSRAKINHTFIFEFDTRNHQDWRQLVEIPCFFLFLLGFFMWLNFSHFSFGAMYLYYPVILIGLSVLILFLPFPILYHRSRLWFLYSVWRLLFPGLYPVEFRDFFLGDMFCSVTYTLGNIALFFCLYSSRWGHADQCNSSHSRLMGFFTTLPGIWRALQCLRRYYDTRNFFPHLVNCGKYTWTIMAAMSLSLYRVDRSHGLHAFFIFCATVNAVYCSIWDLAMDWSLGDPYAQYPFLRQTLGYKQIWMYYGAMIVDPILRFNWIFYAIYADDLQHSTLVAFFVGFTEVLRRGMWMLFRVENEHCTNVGRFRALRDVSLPYEISIGNSDTEQAGQGEQGEQGLAELPELEQAASRASGADLEQAPTTSSSTTRRRRGTFAGPITAPIVRGLSKVGSIMHMAHAQDFERKRRPGVEGGGEKKDSGDASSDEDAENEEELARAEGLIEDVEEEAAEGEGRGEGSS